MELVVGIGYIKTLPGIIKCIELFLTLVTAIWVAADNVSWSDDGKAYLAFAVIAFFVCLTFIGIYMLNIISKFSGLPWVAIEMILSIIFTVLFLIFACLMIKYDGVSAMPEVLGWFLTIVFAVEAVQKFLTLRNA